MSAIVLQPNLSAPFVYVRYPIPEQYIKRLEQFCSKVIVEPWIYGKPEPKPTVDLTQCDVVVTLGIQDSLSILKHAPNVQWVQSLSVGIDAMLHEKIINSDISITNTKGCTSIPIAEHTIAMISSFARGVPAMLQNQAKKKWSLIPVVDLIGATVGIIGYGQIGKEIAKRCKALGMNVIGCRRHLKGSAKEEHADLVVGMNDIDTIISKADFLVLSLPGTEETYHLFNKEKLAKMKETSFLINVGRGNTIVETDLVKSLQNKEIAGAALDVFEVEPLPDDHPFWKLENVIVSPHNAYYSPKTLERNVELFIENIMRFTSGKPLKNIVNKQLGY